MTRLPNLYATRGQVLAQGLLFDAEQLREEQIRVRILAQWRPSSRVYRIAHFVVLLWPNVHSILANRAPGVPLLAEGPHLTTVPLAEAVLGQLNQSDPTLCLVRHGRYVFYSLSQAHREDPAGWLDLTALRLIKTHSLGVAPQPPKLEPLASEDSAVEQLRAARMGGESRPPGWFKALRGGHDAAELPAAAGLGVLGTLFSLLRLRRPNPADPTAGEHNRAIERPSLRDVLARLILSVRLGGLFAQHQAAYMRRLLSLFESGQLDEALRHAVPMSDLQDAIGRPRPALGTPSARPDLSIHPSQRGSRSAMTLSDQLMAHLTSTYQRAFQQLDRAGRYQEAAFVLAELLKDSDRAVDYLEQHGERKLAAELAEGRRLAPERIVRQWVLAGDLARALKIARITGCYMGAIHLLEKRDADLARQLRMEYAELLGNAGQYSEAADVLWPLESHRPQARSWLECVVAQGGPDGARALVRLLALGEQVDTWLGQAATLLSDSDADTWPRRRALTDALIQSSATPVLRRLADLALRVELRDLAAGLSSFHKKRYQQLLNAAQNPSLKADLQALKLDHLQVPSRNLRTLKVPKRHVVGGTGSALVQEVRALGGGYYLVAKGESGVDLINASGNAVRKFNIPCQRIVVSHSRNLAILLARRGSLWRTYRFSLDKLSVSPWIELQANRMTDRYDGLQWLVATDRQLWALDTQASDSVALWSLSDLPGPVLQMSDDQRHLGILFASGSNFEYWRYAQPSMLLRERTPLCREQLSGYDRVSLRADGLLAAAKTVDGVIAVGCGRQLARASWIMLGPQEAILMLELQQDWLLVLTRQSDGDAILRVLDVEQEAVGKVRLEIVLQDQAARWRIEDTELLVVSSSGRLTVISLITGEQVRACHLAT